MKLQELQQGQGDNCRTQCLLDYQQFTDHYHYQCITISLSKQKELDADPRAIQEIKFYGMLRTNLQVCTILENTQVKILKFIKETTKVL